MQDFPPILACPFTSLFISPPILSLSFSPSPTPFILIVQDRLWNMTLQINPKHIHSQTNYRQEQELWPVRGILCTRMEKTSTKMSREMDPMKLGFCDKGRKGKRAGRAVSNIPAHLHLKPHRVVTWSRQGLTSKVWNCQRAELEPRRRNSKGRRLWLERKSIPLTSTAFCFGLNMCPRAGDVA